MKRIFKILLIGLFLLVTIGCQKNVSKVSYARFNEYFSNKEGFRIIDNTSNYDISIRKYIEAGEGNYQIFYIEYDESKKASDYIDSLKDEEGYKVTEYDKYTYVENTNGKYIVAYKVDETIVMAKSSDTKYKNEINKILSDLGY